MNELQTIGKCHKEHLMSSINDKSGSFFYMCYLNIQSSVPVSDVVHHGHFQDLVQYIGLGFNRMQAAGVVVEKLC
jgi:hypothetical protein